jgi:hypothetical protein
MNPNINMSRMAILLLNICFIAVLKPLSLVLSFSSTSVDIGTIDGLRFYPPADGLGGVGGLFRKNNTIRRATTSPMMA